MKEYIKLFNGINSVDGYNINDIPFTSTVKLDSGDTNVNLRCDKTYSKIIVEGGEPKVSREVTITNTWDPSLTDKDTKVIISGNVDLCGKTDCYSIEFEEGGHLTINAGARLRVWEGGIVNSDAEIRTDGGYLTIIEYAANELYGEFLIHPDVMVNNHPKANVEIVSMSYRNSSSDKRYYYISPMMNNGAVIIVTFNASDNITTYRTQIDIWRVASWDNIGVLKEDGTGIDYTKFNEEFGYYLLLSNNPNTTILTYTLNGNLSGNNNKIVTCHNGYTTLCNAFSGKINIKTLYNYLKTLNINFEISQDHTSGKDSFIAVDDSNIDNLSNISPLQYFELYKTGSEYSITLSYKDLIWNPSFEE